MRSLQNRGLLKRTKHDRALMVRHKREGQNSLQNQREILLICLARLLRNLKVFGAVFRYHSPEVVSSLDRGVELWR